MARSAEFEHTSDIHEMPATPEEMYRVLETERRVEISASYWRQNVEVISDSRVDKAEVAVGRQECGHFDVRPRMYESVGSNLFPILAELPIQRMARTLRRR